MPEHAEDESATSTPWGFTGIAIVSLCAFFALFVRVGADAYWLVAMGDRIADRRGIPDGIPFAAAPTDGWPNVLVVAQLVMAGLYSGGGAVLPVAQIVVDATALSLLAVAARRQGASDRATAMVLVAVGLGSLASLAVVRLQVLSLVPFAVLLLLLWSDDRAPSRRIWLLPSLVALWTNLHGAVLLGVAVAGAYLLFGRLRVRPVETTAVGLSTLAALLVTPAGLRTVEYYVNVLDNEAAQRGTGLWARPSMSNGFDVVMLVVAVLLVGAACTRRRKVWEYVVLLGLSLGTLMAARHGVWLLMTAAPLAAAALTRRGAPGSGTRVAPVAVTVGAALVIAGVLVLPRGDAVQPTDPGLVEAVAARAGERVVLAPEPLAESLAVEGVTVWAANPIDAFVSADQKAFLDFLEGGDEAIHAVDGSEAVVVEDDSDAADLMASQTGFDASPLMKGWTLYLRR